MIKKICDKCKNPSQMFWCARCETNCEDETCDECLKVTKLDKNYHDNCNRASTGGGFIEGVCVNCDKLIINEHCDNCNK